MSSSVSLLSETDFFFFGGLAVDGDFLSCSFSSVGLGKKIKGFPKKEIFFSVKEQYLARSSKVSSTPPSSSSSSSELSSSASFSQVRNGSAFLWI